MQQKRKRAREEKQTLGFSTAEEQAEQLTSHNTDKETSTLAIGKKRVSVPPRSTRPKPQRPEKEVTLDGPTLNTMLHLPGTPLNTQAQQHLLLCHTVLQASPRQLTAAGGLA